MFGLFKKNSGPIAPDNLRYTPLRFDLSGNILELAIPDNVSPDMPPTALIPVFDIHAPAAFKDANRVALMKVMYDFPRPGWRKRDYGSMTVTLRVHQKPVSYTGDIFQREHLIKAVQVDLKNDYQAFNDKVMKDGLAAGRLSVDIVDEMMNFCGNTDEWLEDFVFNSKIWVRHIITGLESHGIYCIALEQESYISIDFEFMAASDVHLSDLRNIAGAYMDSIMSQVKLNYRNLGR